MRGVLVSETSHLVGAEIDGVSVVTTTTGAIGFSDSRAVCHDLVSTTNLGRVKPLHRIRIGLDTYVSGAEWDPLPVGKIWIRVHKAAWSPDRHGDQCLDEPLDADTRSRPQVIDTRYHDWGTEVEFAAPPADQVIDAADVPGPFGRLWRRSRP